MQDLTDELRFQVESIFPVNLVAQRFPLPLSDDRQVQMTFEAAISVPQPNQCQVTLTAKLGFDEQPAFHIRVTFIGIFTLHTATEVALEDILQTWSQRCKPHRRQKPRLNTCDAKRTLLPNDELLSWKE